MPEERHEPEECKDKGREDIDDLIFRGDSSQWVSER